jgi:hypothetical protein
VLGPSPQQPTYYDLVSSWYPNGVPVDRFDELVARLRGDAPLVTATGTGLHIVK